jgi:hypothetical protein
MFIVAFRNRQRRAKRDERPARDLPLVILDPRDRMIARR